jgi:hypothetical protein
MIRFITVLILLWNSINAVKITFPNKATELDTAYDIKLLLTPNLLQKTNALLPILIKDKLTVASAKAKIRKTVPLLQQDIIISNGIVHGFDFDKGFAGLSFDDGEVGFAMNFSTNMTFDIAWTGNNR